MRTFGRGVKPDSNVHPVTCYRPMKGLAAFRLRLFVRADRQLAVAQDTIKISHDDGTALTIARGLAVAAAARQPDGTMRRRLYHDVKLELELDEDRLSESYVPKKFLPIPWQVEEPVGKPAYAGDDNVLLGGKPIVLPSSYSSHRILDPAPSKNGVLITTRHDCLELRTLLAADQLLDKPSLGHINMRKHEPHDTSWVGETESDRTVLWSDGSEAGFVFTPTAMGPVKSEHAGTKCFARTLGDVSHPNYGPTITLCFPASAISDDS